ncbi:hypothetical protein JOE40_000750 [Arthrobacter sp. PvP102]|nr:hypothetical protein [Arthrobacter sp. PvP103]MBP1236241.1 hypothetical protein [Arthrobacter sp. PvP102]
MGALTADCLEGGRAGNPALASRFTPARSEPARPMFVWHRAETWRDGPGSSRHTLSELSAVSRWRRSKVRNHAAPLPRLHETPEATSLFVILIPIIAGRVLHATRAPCAGLDPKFRSALLRRLFPYETLNRSRFPKLHSGPSNPALTPCIRTTHTSDRHIRCPPAAEGEGPWNRSPSKPQPTSSVSSGTPSGSDHTRASSASPWTTTASAQPSESTSPHPGADSDTPAQSPTTSPTTPAPPASSSPCTPPKPQNPGNPNRTQPPSQH